MKLGIQLWLISILLVPSPAFALVVDSFDVGDFHLYIHNSNTISESTDEDFTIGNNRYSRLNDLLATPSTIMTSDLVSARGELSFFASGQSINSRPLDLSISYSLGGPYDISGYSDFLFHFTEVTGTGFVVIQLGTQLVPDSETLRVPITEAGWLAVPFAQVNVNTVPFQNFDYFHNLHFTFEAQSQTFGFTLDEISLAAVPEPAHAALACGLLSAAWLASRHRRRPDRHYLAA